MLQPRNLSIAVPLRLLPLGDSITDGWYSSDDNGYRLDLHNMLNASGIAVDFIGSLSKGKNNSDNYYEGFAGKTIDQIHQYVRNDGILSQKPNVVLLHAGTNDMNLDPPLDPYAGAPDRLGALMDEVLCKCPSTTLLVAQIIHDNNAQDRVNTFNAAIPSLVSNRTMQGYKVALVDLSWLGGTDLHDGVHPDDQGYLDMASAWFDAMQSLPDTWITPAGDTNDNVSTTNTIGACRNAATNGTSSATPVTSTASIAASSSTSANTPAPTKGTATRSGSQPLAVLLWALIIILTLGGTT